MLNEVLPPGVSALLPSLQQLTIRQCTLTPAARTSVLDVGCVRLQHIAIGPLSVQAPPQPAAAGAPAQQPPSLQQLATAQLRQLAKLPSLSRVTLDSSCPTLFLVALGAQVTCLFLDLPYRQCEPGTQTPTPGWRATLQHVARCTRLQDLTIPCATAEELRLVAPALQQLLLRKLKFFADSVDSGTDGDAMVDLLLGLPHLTSLEWRSAHLHTFKRWHNDSPCRWESLSFSAVGTQQLARLPLHSLKQPVRWWGLVVRGGTPVQDVRAAVVNVTRRCPAGFQWAAQGRPRLALPGMARHDLCAVLRALQPLFSLFQSLGMECMEWDVEVVKALGEVLPHACTRLVLIGGCMSGEALEQVAHRLPWVRHLELREQEMSPEAVVAYVRLAGRLKLEGAEGARAAVRLEEVVVARPLGPEGVGEARHKQAWEEAVREVNAERGGVALRMES